jgi:ectoine utilization protein EutC
VLITIVTESQLRDLVHLDEEAVAAVEAGFTAIGQGRVTTPPIMRIDIEDHHGEVDLKSAYVQGMDSFAIKIASGFWDNPKKGLPSSSGMMVVWGATDGFPRAVLLDNGYLTDVRTGAAGAIAARHLARQNLDTVGVIGTGMQARTQVMALKIVRDFKRVLVAGRDAARVRQYVDEMSARLGVEVHAAQSREQLVRESDLVVTATPASEPLVMADWLHPGLHITALGSDAEHKQELDPRVLVRADRRVCDVRAQVFRLGEFHHAQEAGLLTPEDDVIELGAITSGKALGRQSDGEITVCDLTGTGVQDTAIALLAYRRAQEAGVGLAIES